MKNEAIRYSRLKGQERAKRLLRRSVTSGRLPHGCLFRGPEGVGKTLFARGLAAALNCQAEGRKDLLEACGECISCRKYASGNHPDFMLIQPRGAGIKVDQVREMITSLEYPPFEAKVRVVVMEDVHVMTTQAANALLKTLEEPRPGNLLVLTADSSRDVPATLVSRCQTISFAPLSFEETVDILQEKHELERAEAELLSRLAGGSPGRALTLRTFGIVPLWTELVEFLSDPEKRGDLHLLDVLDFAARMAELKSELDELFALLRRWLRDLLLDDRDSLSLYHPVREGETDKRWNSERLSAKMRALERAEQQLSRNCNRALVCEILLFNLQA
ncbi:DNA polymerase III subunit delta' [Desulforhopalus vacuolatus]|uniref:DNA polymerase III subunit delta' n=1 Tax=Desulforhopalus vacuolatus TaxID=40414 RepID=UPI001963B5BF|nr:DNA polymerase III subunit delta' [Desulforhopalus vacuolatus]MBM9518426.1 DNA polymerase III subunit delta' [Desulforhopalus vacuolatus]